MSRERDNYVNGLKRDFNEAQKKIEELEKWKDEAAKQLAERQAEIDKLRGDAKTTQYEWTKVSLEYNEQLTYLTAQIAKLRTTINNLLDQIAPDSADMDN